MNWKKKRHGNHISDNSSSGCFLWDSRTRWNSLHSNAGPFLSETLNCVNHGGFSHLKTGILTYPLYSILWKCCIPSSLSKYFPLSGTLYLLFASYSSLKSLLGCHLLQEAFPILYPNCGQVPVSYVLLIACTFLFKAPNTLKSSFIFYL